MAINVVSIETDARALVAEIATHRVEVQDCLILCGQVPINWSYKIVKQHCKWYRSSLVGLTKGNHPGAMVENEHQRDGSMELRGRCVYF